MKQDDDNRDCPEPTIEIITGVVVSRCGRLNSDETLTKKLILKLNDLDYKIMYYIRFILSIPFSLYHVIFTR